MAATVPAMQRQHPLLAMSGQVGTRTSLVKRNCSRMAGGLEAEAIAKQPRLLTTTGLGSTTVVALERSMSQPSGKPMYIPPFAGVRLIECRDHFELVAVPAVRVLYGYGKVKASEATVDPDDPHSEPFWDGLGPDEEVWAVMQWFRYDDGHQEQGNISFLRPECTEEEVRQSLERMKRFAETTREEAQGILQCYDAPEEDHQFVEDNYPNYQSEPDPSSTREYDVYHARLKVLGELQPKTVELIKIANATKDPVKRQYVERQAVQSFFAELAHYCTEEEVRAWQRTNPVGTEWMCEFAEVMREPRRQLDPINHELALNWLRSRYNEMTAKQLSDSVWGRVWKWLSPGFRLTADFIKKRRERLGLTSKRPPGPPPRSPSQ